MVLLKVLQEGEFERVGGTETRSVDVRLVAASHEILEQAVKAGRFRADLFYRLNVYPVHIPALRERKDDIPLLVEHFLGKYQTRYNKRLSGVSNKAMQALMDYDWPGNIRELENMVERGVILTDNNQAIDLQALSASLNEPREQPLEQVDNDGQLRPSGPKASEHVDPICDELLSAEFSFDSFEARLLKTAMVKANGNVSKAARILGLSRGQLAYRLEKLDVEKR